MPEPPAVTAPTAKSKKVYAKIPETLWNLVKAEYVAGKGSCKDLGKKHGIAPYTVSKRCQREGWRLTEAEVQTQLTRAVHRQMSLEVSQSAKALATRANLFVGRVQMESESWLDRVQQAKDCLKLDDFDGLAKLVQAWKVPVQVGRQAYGLDQSAGPTVQVGVFGGGDVVRIAAGGQCIDVSSGSSTAPGPVPGPEGEPQLDTQGQS